MTAPVRIVVMGVSACGKSTVAGALADRLGLPCLEGDDLHPAANVAAMRAGQPLDDGMRAPWLDAVADRMAGAPRGMVASCSALKRIYRDRLRRNGPVFFLHLVIDRDTARTRLANRPGHFMNPALADSQFATLEPLGPGEWGVAIDATRTLDGILSIAVPRLQVMTD